MTKHFFWVGGTSAHNGYQHVSRWYPLLGRLNFQAPEIIAHNFVILFAQAHPLTAPLPGLHTLYLLLLQRMIEVLFLFGWHTWRGESGRPYRFNITLTKRGVPAGGGIYVFVRRRFVFFLKPVYIGKAANLRSRLKGHERWWEAWWKRGATERHLLKVAKESDRIRIEEDLIRRYQPKMNNMLVPRGRDDAPRHPRLRRWWNFKRKFRLPFMK